MKDMTLRPEGSDSEFIGVIVLNRPFYTVFYATPSGLLRLVKTPIFIESKCAKQKIRTFL